MSSAELMMDTSKTDTTVQRNVRMKKEVIVAEDLIMEILFRLPSLSVMKFKSVCKSWYSLITNPCFLTNHVLQFHLSQRNRSRRRLDPPCILLSPNSSFPDSTEDSVYDHDDQEEQKPLPFLKLYLDHSLPAFFSRSFLIDSCNGLLLYYTINPNSDTPDQYYMVFNPITNQYKEVPIMDLLGNFIKQNVFGKTIVLGYPHIVFDPFISLSYKVLTVLYGPPYADFRFYIYSDDTGSWTFLKSFSKSYFPLQRTFMLDGVFYWLSQNAFICFDVVKESIWFLPLPSKPGGFREVLYFGECGGRLRLIENYFRYGCWFPFSFDIMEMEQGSTIWTVKSRVNIEAGYDHLIQERRDPTHHGVVRVMHLFETEKGEEVVLLNVDYEKLVSFNITTNTFGKELNIPNFEHYDCLNAFSFTPTLFPLIT